MSYIKAYLLLSILLLIIHVSFLADQQTAKGNVKPKSKEKRNVDDDDDDVKRWREAEEEWKKWKEDDDENDEKKRCSEMKKQKCDDDHGCKWDSILSECIARNKKIEEIEAVANIMFEKFEACFHNFTDPSLNKINAKVEKPAEVPTCFKDFHDIALKPICGHLMFNRFKYCQIGAFYENNDYDKVDLRAIDRILMLFDGCFVCSDQNYFRKHKVDIKIETGWYHTKINDVDSEGNFLLGMQVYPPLDKNVSIVIRHRCNLNNLVQYKIINIELEDVVDYPSRVWKSVNTVIGLEGVNVKQKFTDLYGKRDKDEKDFK